LHQRASAMTVRAKHGATERLSAEHEGIGSIGMEHVLTTRN
jgi:hypothetical protein